jgi:hypothetical protein
MKTFQTQVYNQINPIGFDLEIYLIQRQLQRICWLEACFGVAHRQKRILSEGEAKTREEQGFRGSQKYQVWYPQGFKNQIGVASTIIDQDLSFDDSYASRIFFLMRETNINPKSAPYNWTDLDVTVAQSCSLILHCNLDALEVATSEQIKTDILWVLNSCSRIVGLEICESIEEVWKEFDLTIGINGVTRYPNYCLRVDMIITYPAFPENGRAGYDPSTSICSTLDYLIYKEIFTVVGDGSENYTHTIPQGYLYAQLSILSGASRPADVQYSLSNISISGTVLSFQAGENSVSSGLSGLNSTLDLFAVYYK